MSGEREQALADAAVLRRRDRQLSRAQRNVVTLADELREAEARREQLEQALSGALDAVVWMSGSPSFGSEGEAHEGWVKVRDDWDRWYAALSGRGGEQDEAT